MRQVSARTAAVTAARTLIWLFWLSCEGAHASYIERVLYPSIPRALTRAIASCSETPCASLTYAVREVFGRPASDPGLISARGSPRLSGVMKVPTIR